jgi:hypothetical protein
MTEKQKNLNVKMNKQRGKARKIGVLLPEVSRRWPLCEMVLKAFTMSTSSTTQL